jgi:hypothetical protein
VGPGMGQYAAFQPGSATAMSYDDLKVVEAHDFLRSIAEGRSCGAALPDAVRAAVVMDALERSAAGRAWVDLPTL